jgi:hypothetical protein
MAEKKTLEGKVNALQKDMSTIVKVMKEWSAAVKKLEAKDKKKTKPVRLRTYLRIKK